MKKIILFASLVTSLAGLSASGQGYFLFVTGKSQVYDGFSTGTVHTSSNVNVAFLWSASGDIPLVSSLMTHTPTNGFPTYTSAAAWNDILHDPNFQLAVNADTSAQAITPSTATGALSYNRGSAFPVLSTSPGATYSLFFIGWDATYATPAAAAAAYGGYGAYVGWSSVFSYTASTITGVPNTMMGQTAPFGVVGLIPEPTTLVVAGLGGLTLLLFGRRKLHRLLPGGSELGAANPAKHSV